MSAPLVSLARQADYDPSGVRNALETLLAPLGGMAAFVKAGDRVVLKPNLVMGFAPEKAATTHPAVVRAAAELALECGAKVSAGDSPGIGTARSAACTAGVLDALADLNVDIIEFTPVETTLDSGTYRRQTVAKELLEADAVINLAKLKTHQQMLMTMAVKNLFGAVVGTRKFQWHYRAGKDRLTFARMLYDVCRTIRPALSIVDGIVGMDGAGPTHGTPRPVGLLAAGSDPCAVDAVLLDVLGIDRQRLYTLQAAEAAGDVAWKEATATGIAPAELRPETWTMPETAPLAMIGPRFLKQSSAITGWLRKRLTARPYVRPETCKRCGACIEVCPAKAMTMKAEGVRIDRVACIECYCCDELCPHDAIELRQGLLGRLLSR